MTQWTVESSRAGDAFGFSLNATGDLLVGAPEGPLGRVYKIENEGLTLVFEEEDFGAAGFSIARDENGAVFVGAPLADSGSGRIYRDGQIHKTGTSALGGYLHFEGGERLFSESKAYWLNEALVSLPARLSSAAFWNEEWVIGMAQGSQALVFDEGVLARSTATGLEGYALCAANFDDDPDQELAVGAPGSGQVLLLNPGETLEQATRFGPKAGRFGHSLACEDGLLLVGAPTYGEDLSGAAWLFTEFTEPETEADPFHTCSPWQQAGFSVAVSATTLAVGSPGNAYTPGSVTGWTR